MARTPSRAARSCPRPERAGGADSGIRSVNQQKGHPVWGALFVGSQTMRQILARLVAFRIAF